MMTAPLPVREIERLLVLQELYRIQDLADDPALQAIVRLAQFHSGWPMCAISLVETERQWFPAEIGLGVSETPRAIAFCAHAILGDATMEVEDARCDLRFADNPLVTGDPKIRAYVGAPLIVEGHPVGTLCTISPQPQRLSESAVAALRDLAMLAGTMLDDRLRAARWRRQEARVRDASRASSDWLWESDAEGRITWLSDSVEAHTGQSASALIGQPSPHRPSADPLLRPAWDAYQAARAERRPFKDAIAERDGPDRTIMVSFSGNPVFDRHGVFMGYRGAARDITAELLQQAQAQRIEALLRDAMEQIHVAMMISDPQGCIVASNAAWRRNVTPYTDGKAVTWEAQLRQLVERGAYPDAVGREEAFIAWRLGLVERLGDHGEVRFGDLQVLVSDQRLADGSVVHIGVDLTDRKRAEDALRDKQAVELASRAKTEFLARMSHEMRTPLNAVIGFAQLLRLNGGQDRSQPVPYSDHILQAGQHLLALVNDVLDLQQVEEGRLTLQTVALRLHDVVESALDLVRPSALARAIAVSGSIDPTLAVQADSQRLRQVLLNVLSNGVKYNRDGGRLRCGVESVDATHCVLHVEDDGPGLSAEQLARLFQPFERLGFETSAIEGTGLGLIIARRLMQEMGGSLELTSRDGAGTTVRLRLLRAAAAAPSAASATATSAAAAATPGPAEGRTPTAPLRLLYVEDNRINALLFEEALRLRGDIELRIAEDGDEALELVESWLPEVLVLDAHLPGMSGLELLQRLRARPGFVATPAFMCSADAMPEDVQRALDHGFIGYWTKPIDLARVMRDLDALPRSPPG